MGEASGPLALVRRALPRTWRVVRESDNGRAAECRGLAVIETVNREADGRRWHHVSLSRAGRLPTWDDLKVVRNLFIGEDDECYQVLPPRARYVNRHNFCLHLWRCLDVPEGAVLPDFRHDGEV